VTSAAAIVAGTTVTATATCASGKVALGGGGRATTTAGPLTIMSIQSSYPSATDTWTVIGQVGVTLILGNTMTVTAYVLCSQ
jgi:hypothetical protein